MFVTRAVFEEIGGFPDQPLFEDYVLARTLEKTVQTNYITDPIVTTSARRFAEEPIRTVLVWTALQCAFSLGVPASRLARFYADARQPVHA